MKEFLRLVWFGVAAGCTIFTVIGVILALILEGGDPFREMEYGFVRMAAASMVTGLGFSLPSLVYDCENLPFAVRTAVHLVIGFGVYFAASFWAGWIPLAAGPGAVILFFLAAVVIALAIWLGFFLYHRAEARRLNEKIQERRG
ncbi:MAG TPA: DUF3021 domain-containing protein [Candidatus Enterenecus merdae]|nr:DUF3021 domain-containing protein [Candidatus Enterenecus merdae]